MNERETGVTVKQQGTELVKTDEFQYLGQQIKAIESAQER